MNQAPDDQRNAQLYRNSLYKEKYNAQYYSW